MEELFDDEVKYVYVASTNLTKVQAVRNILEPLGYQVIGVKGKSNVSNQPKSEAETLQGAINRALNLSDGYLKIGLEAGVEEVNGIMFLINYAAMVDEDENIYLAGGTRIPLPTEIRTHIQAGLELKDAMEKVYNTTDINQKEGAIGFFTNNYVKRVEIFEHLIKLLYGQYLHQKK